MAAPTFTARHRRRMRNLERFVSGVGVQDTPRAVRLPHSREEWKSLGADERRAHLEALATEELRRQDAAAAAYEASRKAAAAATPAPVAAEPERPALLTTGDGAQFVAGRSYLPCADGCGQWYRTRAERPGLRFCPTQK